MITREEALELLKNTIKSEAMIRHSLASEAVMCALADHFGEDRGKWGVAGLLHDLDVEITEGDMKRHGHLSVEMLKDKLDQEQLDAILLHNEDATDIERSTRFQHALAAGETITGLITATTLVYPDRKLSSVKPKSVVKRMKEKHFAASVKRENIMECEVIGIPIADFAVLAINAMSGISDELGL